MTAPRPRPAPAAALSRLFVTPLVPRPRLRRLVWLYLGLVLFGLGGALLVRAELGAMPWDVLHQGLSLRTGLSIGTWSVIAGTAVMLLWIPLRQRPGLGTVSNVVVLGLSIDLFLWLLPENGSLEVRLLMLVAGVAVCGVGSGYYIGAGLGPGPRDGLMTGLAERGWSVRMARMVIEVVVVVTGALLGGTVGVGTVVFALSIGPMAQAFLSLLRIPDGNSGATVPHR
ncbi:YczE/YyaS/YitT family protein [Nocardiopsis sp. LOL_012]|uniref:membrane protein YczE n=1 Tax=Nocardiopsis sp. LOL_012 TaxID=3345409 RepID=UPI003A878D4C